MNRNCLEMNLFQNQGCEKESENVKKNFSVVDEYQNEDELNILSIVFCISEMYKIGMHFQTIKSALYLTHCVFKLFAIIDNPLSLTNQLLL